MRLGVAATALSLLAVGAVVPAEAQTSVYGVLGVGFPGRPLSIRARALGGSTGPTDAGSAVNPAALALNSRLSVSGISQTTGRNYEAGDVSVESLRDTRFPFAMITGPLPASPLAVGISYSLYFERSYDIETVDTVLLRGEEVVVSDRLKSDGGVADLRGALAWYVSPRLQIGAGLHLLSGSTREELQREFDNPLYTPVEQRGDVDYSGWAVSAGAVVTPASKLRIGLSARRDSRLSFSDQLLPAIEVQLPWTFSGTVVWAPMRVLRWAVMGEYRTWSEARDDVPEGITLSVFDTWEVGSGIEIGGPELGGSAFPLRIGVRYAALPFSPIDDQPTELDLSAGSGVLFANNRALLEFAVERVIRDGGGASERAWQIAFGLTLRP
jgi:hypothetical protein